MSTTTTINAIWKQHEHGALAATAAATPVGSRERLAALRALALRCGFSPLTWTEVQLETLLIDGPAPDVATVTTAEVDYDRVRAIAAEEARRVLPVIERVVVHGKTTKAEVEGAHAALFDVLIHLKHDHVLLHGPAGSGKTTLAEQVAKVLPRTDGGVGVKYYSSGAVYRESRLLGYTFPKADGTIGIVRTDFRIAFEEGGVFLIDEIDASDPNALCAFNQALANKSCAFPDRRVDQHPDFRCIASANSLNGATRLYAGRNTPDAATFDRFQFIEVGYDEKLELRIAKQLGDVEWGKLVQSLRHAAAKVKVEHLITPRATIKGIAVLHDYIANGITREDAVERVLKSTVWKGLSKDKITAIKAAV